MSVREIAWLNRPRDITRAQHKGSTHNPTVGGNPQVREGDACSRTSVRTAQGSRPRSTQRDLSKSARIPRSLLVRVWLIGPTDFARLVLTIPARVSYASQHTLRAPKNYPHLQRVACDDGDRSSDAQ